MDAYKQQVTEFFNSRTAYDREGSHHPREAKRLLEFVNIQAGHKILDVATGTGLVAIAAAQKVGSSGSVTGVDFSAGMLTQARQKIEAAELQNVELLEADADSLNFETGSFDVIFCCSAIVYLTNIPVTLHSWYRFLNRSGVVAFSCAAETAYLAPVQIAACRKFGISLPHINQPLGTPEKCDTLLKQAGFQEIAIVIEPSGRYLPLDDCGDWWIENGFYPSGNPLLLQSQELLQNLKTEYNLEFESGLLSRVFGKTRRLSSSGLRNKFSDRSFGQCDR